MRGFRVQLLVLGFWLAIFHDTSFTNGRPSRDGWQRGRIARLAKVAKDPYAVLGVEPGSTEQEIRAAYRQRARTEHPDINDAPNAEEVWLEVCEAYKVLTDPKRRSRKNGMTKQGSTYRDDERVQDDSEIKKQFFEALGVMPTEQKKTLKMTLEDLKQPKLSSRSDAAEQARRKKQAEAQQLVVERPKVVSTGKSA